MIAVIGDTQRTLPLERLFLGRPQNDAPRARLVDEIAAARPDLLVHLGDMVARGSSRADWARFDRLLAPVRAADIPVLPALGNHDRWGRPARAAREVGARFPWLAGGRGWYDRRHGPLRLVWLDTDRRRLAAGRWTEQAGWFAAVLAAADRDPGTAGVVAFAHHPPFTNSRVTGDAADVRRAFVGPFCAARKGLAFVSGHAHAYERFAADGKAFVVSGGGGGPRVRLRRGAAARHPDLFAGPSPRPFHYLTLEPVSRGLRVAVRGLADGYDRTTTIDEFVLPYPAVWTG